MTIRARFTLWFGGILLISLVLLAGVVRYEWLEHQAQLEHQDADPSLVWEEVGEVVLLYGIPTALLSLIGGWWLLRYTMAPVTSLTEAVERIHARNLKDRLPQFHTGDELGRLAQVFNAMMERLDQSFDHIRQFTLHASHELKTPLTILRGSMEMRLQSPATSAEERTHLAAQLDEIQRLTHIVDGLALLAKADTGHLLLKREPVRLDELVEETFADAQVLADPAGIRVTRPVCEETLVIGDRHRLRQLLLILTDNAIKYNHPNGEVTLALTCRNGAARMVITNTGPGVEADQVPMVFDRFYRGQNAPSQAPEGCGLGLSVAEWIVRAHNGRIELTSALNRLTTVAFTLPCAA